ncbi:MAG: hypothetical protein K2X47_15475, partial [Bdellovibrionales bacterium]|nr:hypothetical protein [Bdellovibrionales bacterium]
MVFRLQSSSFFFVLASFILLSGPALAQFPLLAAKFEGVSGSEISATAVTLYGSRVGRGSGGVDYGYCSSAAPCNTCQDQPGATLRACNIAAIDPTV